jgi:hypothetical protein
MLKKQKKHRYGKKLLIVAIGSCLLWTSGCKTPLRLDNTKRLIEMNPQGFRDAVESSPAGRKFVEDSLEVIIDLEYELEKETE